MTASPPDEWWEWIVAGVLGVPMMIAFGSGWAARVVIDCAIHGWQVGGDWR